MFCFVWPGLLRAYIFVCSHILRSFPLWCFPWGPSLAFRALSGSSSSGVLLGSPPAVTPTARSAAWFPSSHPPPDHSRCTFSGSSPTPTMSPGNKTPGAPCKLKMWFSCSKSRIKCHKRYLHQSLFLSSTVSQPVKILNFLFIVTHSEEKLSFFIIIMNFPIHLHISQSRFSMQILEHLTCTRESLELNRFVLCGSCPKDATG